MATMNKYANMELNRGDVVWIQKTESETVGGEQFGTRPYIIVSNDMANFYSPVILAVPLTSKRKKPMPTHAVVTLMEKTSIALCEQVSTVSVDRIISKIDSVNRGEMLNVDRALRVALFL